MQFHQHFGHALTFWPLLLLCLEHSFLKCLHHSFPQSNVTFSRGPSYEKFGTSILHIYPTLYFSSVHWLSRVRLFATPWTAACQASLSITNSRSLLKLTSIESMMPSDHFILCRPLLCRPAFNLSQHQGLFQWVSWPHQVAKVLEFQLQHHSKHIVGAYYLLKSINAEFP